MKKSTLLTIAFLCFGLILSAQDAKKSLATLKSNHNAVITLNDVTGLAEFVRFPVGNAMTLNGGTLQQKAFSFLNDYKAIYDIQAVAETLVFEKVKTDNYGMNSVVLNQVYKGVTVYDGQLKFHFNKENKLTSINGNYISGISKLNQIPAISSQKASTIAIELINKQALNASGAPLLIHSNKLMVFAKGLAQGHVKNTYLVYEIEVRNELDVREFIYVNAHTGEITEQFTGMAHALNRKIYETNTGNLIWQEGDAFPGTLTIWQKNEVQASGHVYNFFNNAFGFTSYNGADAVMRTINNNPNISCPNANWNGVTANYCDGTAADDVIAHEWGHAYTEYTSGLIYAYQSGAINESFSDIWGETVDLLNNYEDAGENLNIRTNAGCNSTRWKIGEDASAFGSPIRDMWNPNCNGDPGKVTDVRYSCGDFDAGGVHINSGIPNHAYALLVDGGTYNGQTVGGIGFVKAAHIFWRAQSVYLTQTSDFAVLADALEASATDLIGMELQGLSTTEISAGLSDQIITASDVQQVINALFAVELRINPDACAYTPILGPTPALCEAATTNPLYSIDWETGLNGWTLEQLPTNPSTWQSRDWTIVSALPAGRAGSAIFAVDGYIGNCTTDKENGTIRLQSPIITIPNITTGTFEMAFNHYVATEAEYDGGNLKYRINDGPWTIVPSDAFTQNPYNDILVSAAAGNDNPLQGQVAFTGTDEGALVSTWGQSVVDLSALGVTANATVEFRFEFGTDGCNGNDGWYVDEIVIYNCSAVLSVADANLLENGVKIYPNPSNGIFTMKKIRNIDLVQAEIYDINGRTIKVIDLKGMQNEMEIDITNFASGVYFMSLSSKDAKSVVKLIRE